MTLYEQIKEDIKVAMRAKDRETLDVLRLLTSGLKTKAIDSKREIEEEDVIAAIRSELKKLQDAINDFSKAGREDLVEKSEGEAIILKKYLPPEMSDDDLKEAVGKVLSDNGISGADQIGRAIGTCMKELGGSVDGNRVRIIVEKSLRGE